MKILKKIDKDMFFLGASSATTFVSMYFINILLPENIAVEVSYIISIGYLVGGLAGIILLNGLKFENPQSVKSARLDPFGVFLLCGLFLLAPVLLIVIFAFFRMGMSRSRPNKHNLVFGLFVILALILGNVLCYVVSHNPQFSDYEFNFLPLGVVSISLAILIASGRAYFFIPTFQFFNLKYKDLPVLVTQIGCRLSYDAVIFLIPFALINLVQLTLAKADASAFFVIYSVMGMSGLISNVIESKMLADQSSGNLSWNVGRGVVLICALTFFIPFFWLIWIVGLESPVSIVTGLCSVVGVLIGIEGVALRKKLDARKIGFVSCILILSCSCVFSIYLLSGFYSLFFLLLSYLFALLLFFALIRCAACRLA